MEICKVLAQEGAILVIIGRQEFDTLKAIKEIEGLGYSAVGVQAELTNPAECEKAIEQVITLCGRIDGVNDNVGLESRNYDHFIASLHKNLVHFI